MNDGIDVHFDSKRGLLTLTCGEKAFAELRDTVCKSLPVSEITGSSMDAIRFIEIEPTISLTRSRLMPTIGCLSLAIAMLFALGVGIVTIVRWFL